MGLNSDLIEKLKAATEFDERVSVKYSLDDRGETVENKWDFVDGARWQHAQLEPIIAALIEAAEIIVVFNRKYSPGENWFPELREALDKIEAGLGEKK